MGLFSSFGKASKIVKIEKQIGLLYQHYDMFAKKSQETSENIHMDQAGIYMLRQKLDIICENYMALGQDVLTSACKTPFPPFSGNVASAVIAIIEMTANVDDLLKSDILTETHKNTFMQTCQLFPGFPSHLTFEEAIKFEN
jgi:hypothetical protein